MSTVALNTSEILDWESFHSVSASAFGFPAFYGRNMNAFVDCLSYLDLHDGMSSVSLSSGERLEIVVVHAAQFSRRLPEVSAALLETIAHLNQRYIQRGMPATILLVPT